MINAYAPTSTAEDEKVEQFYDDNVRAIADSDSKYKIITGDFNAKIGTKAKEDFKSMGAFGIVERNERGDRLLEFTEEHNLIIANTLFQKSPKKKKKEKRKKTKQQQQQQKQKAKTDTGFWESPDGETRNQIDFTLSSQRGIVTKCEVITKADIGSDH